MSIKLGSKVRCKVTGFEGIATAHVEYLNGCHQYCVRPRVGSDGKSPDPEYIDVGQLEVIGEGINVPSSNTGGPQRDQPRH